MSSCLPCSLADPFGARSYYASLIRETHVTVASVLATAVSQLTTEQQVELVGEISKVLAQKGIRR